MIQNKCKYGTAFTLIELIIIISIIAILASILLPALAKAKKKVFEIQCASNMRQAGVAIWSYAVDNQDHAPMMMNMQGYYLWKIKHPFSTYCSVTKAIDFNAELSTFKDCNPLLCCPLIRPAFNGDPNLKYGSTLPIVGNGRLMRKKSQVENNPDAKNPLSLVKHTTKMCLMGEYGDKWAPLAKSNLAFPHNNSNPTGMPLSSSNRSNILFVDGHVSLIKYSELGDLPEFYYLQGVDQGPFY